MRDATAGPESAVKMLLQARGVPNPVVSLDKVSNQCVQVHVVHVVHASMIELQTHDAGILTATYIHCTLHTVMHHNNNRQQVFTTRI